MTTTAATETKKTPFVGMGQIELFHRPAVSRAVVGSCIGLVLYHRRRGVGQLAHIVLPEAAGRTGLPGKFADTAIPHMLEALQEEGAFAAGLVATLAGGGNMFGSSGPLQVGDANVEAVVNLLNQHRIPIHGQSVGGLKGRRLAFDSATGEMTVEIVGEPSITI